MRPEKEKRLREKWKDKNDERIERMRMMRDILQKEKAKREAAASETEN